MQQPPYTRPIIRDYRPEDVDRFHEIDGICFPAGLAYTRAEILFYTKHRFSVAFVAEWQSGIVGFAIGRVEGGRLGHIITVDVLPEARRCGVGTALMAALHEAFRARGIVQVMLEVEAGNEAAQDFYLSLGYQRGELVRNYYPGRRDAYRMELTLDA